MNINMTNTESAMDQLADLSQSVQEESKRRSKRSLDTAMDISEDGSTLKKKKSEQDQHSSQRSLFPIRKENDLKMDTSTSNDFTMYLIPLNCLQLDQTILNLPSSSYTIQVPRFPRWTSTLAESSKSEFPQSTSLPGTKRYAFTLSSHQ